MNFKVKNINIDNEVVAKVFKYKKLNFKGINFFTENNLNFQVGLMAHKKNHKIEPHYHLNKKKKIKSMSEFLIIFKGSIKVNFYDKKFKLKKNVILNPKDMILLIKGGHGFEVIKKVSMLEIKQGPFHKEIDKIRF
jgi:cupin fold WbuC family metalloprotein|tara:strand:- start:16 stop:423 length:408 start_codon:yes stop_codon:yes gene_type:complete